MPPDRRFIIFLSDGEANIPNGNLADNYIAGTNVPTTFTVFFSRNPTPPPKLLTMTNNIKGNGYSSKNPSSSIWAIQTDYPTLMKLLIDSVLTNIINTISNHPDSIIFNGNGSQVWDSLNNVFTFGSMFPLLGVNTDFKYRVKYTVFRQVINGNDTQIISFDSTAEGKYSVTIQTGAVTPDTFDVKCWDRGLSFYNKNIKITQLNENMTELDVRFTYDPGLAKYDYKNAVIELTTLGDGSGKTDKESIGLMKNGLVFSGIIPLDVNDNPAINDGKLQVRFQDKVYAVFRNSENPKLPLDTLKDSIPYKVSGTITVKQAYYLDNTGDGFIDSISVVTDNIINAEQVKEISDKNLISLPGERKFTNISYKYLNNKNFAIVLSQDKGGLNDIPTTSVVNYDKLITTQHIFTVGGWLFGGTIDIQDRIAPVIMSASAQVFTDDSKADTLKVVFSEDVNPVVNVSPFWFIRPASSVSYCPTFVKAIPSSIASAVTFVVGRYNNVDIENFEGKDSIWINWQQNNVGDSVTGNNNYQVNEKNVRRELVVEYIVPKITVQILSTSPFIINDLANTVKIPDKILNVLPNIGEINKLGNHVLIIQVKPIVSDSVKAQIEFMRGAIDIYDPLGNVIVATDSMGFEKVSKTLNYGWTGRTSNGRVVGGGTYLAIIKRETKIFKNPAITSDIDKIFVGVKKNPKKK
jgi:hypothetical protein